MQTSTEYLVRFYATLFFVIVVSLVTIPILVLVMCEKSSHAQSACRLEEARQISCAAAKTSFNIDHNWPRAQGIFSTNMTHLSCEESRKWDGVCH